MLSAFVRTLLSAFENYTTFQSKNNAHAKRLLHSNLELAGEMAEWFKAHAWKA